jgi:hypothetical protein
MFLQCSCHALAMCLPCSCHDIAMPLPCSCHVLTHALARAWQAHAKGIRPEHDDQIMEDVLLPCYCHVLAMFLHGSCHAISMLFPCSCWVLPWFCHAHVVLEHAQGMARVWQGHGQSTPPLQPTSPPRHPSPHTPPHPTPPSLQPLPTLQIRNHFGLKSTAAPCRFTIST